MKFIFICFMFSLLLSIHTSNALDITINTDFIEKPLYQSIAEKVALSNEWVYKSFMCLDFSKQLVIKLLDKGYNAHMKLGHYYNEQNNTNCSASNWQRFRCKHYWVIVEVPIEATTGEIIPIDKYRQEYH